MEVSLRYADINTKKYSPFKSFSGDQTFKDKSFNIKLKLIEETGTFPELSIGFRDFIGTGKFASEYIVSSKKVGDFDFSVGLGWGSLSSSQGIENPFINISNNFLSRNKDTGRGGNFQLDRWFTGGKVSSFYGFEYQNKRSGIRFKVDYDTSNPFYLDRKSNFSFGLAIPASNLIDINIFRHRGTDLGFSLSYKANYSKPLIKKQEILGNILFTESDSDLIRNNDAVFAGTMNVLLNSYGIYTQEIILDDENITFIVENSKYRKQSLANKRIIQQTSTLLKLREIKNVSIVYKQGNILTNEVSFPLHRFVDFIENNSSIPELQRFVLNDNYFKTKKTRPIFQGEVKYPTYTWGINPNLKNHVGAPESFYSGHIGIYFNGGIVFNDRSFFDATASVALGSNMDQLRLRSFSRLPKVRSDIREYLKERYSIVNLNFTHLFSPVYRRKGLFISGLKIGLFEEMYGGVGSAFLFRDINQPWFLSGNFYWIKQREFSQRLSFRNYETFTGHLNFTWETPFDGVKATISAGRYLARDSGITINLSKTFSSGFTLGAFATKTDISAEEFGEGSFDKGIYFSIPLDLVSSKYRKNNARFIWRNLTRDGGAMLSGGLDIEAYIDGSSNYYYSLYEDGLKE